MRVQRNNLWASSLFLIAILLQTGCANVERSMIFATGTTVGLDVSTEAGTPYPVRFVLGYRRAEILLDPVMTGPVGPTATNTQITPDSHAVLAKLTGRISSGTEVTGGQWFASGEAAIELAKHPATAAALTNDPQAVAQAISAMDFKGAPMESSEYYEAMYIYLHAKASASPADAQSKKQTDALNQSASSLISALNDSALYDYNQTTTQLSKSRTSLKGLAGGDAFKDLLEMLKQCTASRDELKQALTDDKDPAKMVNYTNAAPITNAAGITKQIAEQDAIIRLIEKYLESDDAVILANKYFQQQIAPK